MKTQIIEVLDLGNKSVVTLKKLDDNFHKGVHFIDSKGVSHEVIEKEIVKSSKRIDEPSYLVSGLASIGNIEVLVDKKNPKIIQFPVRKSPEFMEM